MKEEGSRKTNQASEVVPLFGRDELNLIEFPFGPVTGDGEQSYEVENRVFDKTLGREVCRKILITGSNAFGLPKPVDDQVLVGLLALTAENRFDCRKVEFSRYQLCKVIGWSGDGKAYRRIEESLDRIAGTTLKFKDAWWDKGEMAWKSKTFHLIDNVELCSRDGFDRARKTRRGSKHSLCSFTWNEVIWKSFTDGYIRKLDMEMYRKISRGKRREVSLRLYRVLHKRFYRGPIARFEVRRLCNGILGLSQSAKPSELIRSIERASDWLIRCGALGEFRMEQNRRTGVTELVFCQSVRFSGTKKQSKKVNDLRPSKFTKWYDSLDEDRKRELVEDAIEHARTHAPHLLESYERTRESNGAASAGYRKLLIEKLVLNQATAR